LRTQQGSAAEPFRNRTPQLRYRWVSGLNTSREVLPKNSKSGFVQQPVSRQRVVNYDNFELGPSAEEPSGLLRCADSGPAEAPARFQGQIAIASSSVLLHLARRCGWRVAKWSRFPSRRLPEVLKAVTLGIADGVQGLGWRTPV
jgi:hypothetical protein